MFNSLKTGREISAASDNEKNRYYVYSTFCSPLTAILVTLGLGLSPNNNLSMLKGQVMQAPTCGSRPTQLILNLQQNPGSLVYQAGTAKVVSNLVSNRAEEIPSSSPLVPSPLDWILNPSKAPRLGELGSSGRVEEIYDRILARLIQLEAHEGEDSLRDDYRIAWLIVRFCQTGEAKLCTPQVLATYKVIGCHPDQVWPRIVARRKASIGNPAFIAIGPKSSPKPIDAARRKA